MLIRVWGVEFIRINIYSNHKYLCVDSCRFIMYCPAHILYSCVFFCLVFIPCIYLCICQCIFEFISVSLCTWYIYPIISCMCTFYLCMGINSCVFVRLFIYYFAVLHHLEVWFNLLLLNWFEFPPLSIVVTSIIHFLSCILFKIWMLPLLYYPSNFSLVDTIHVCMPLFSLYVLLYLI